MLTGQPHVSEAEVSLTKQRPCRCHEVVRRCGVYHKLNFALGQAKSKAKAKATPKIDGEEVALRDVRRTCIARNVSLDRYGILERRHTCVESRSFALESNIAVT
jgi:hypothetical protein